MARLIAASPRGRLGLGELITLHLTDSRTILIAVSPLSK
jgi:hypothetical protein